MIRSPLKHSSILSLNVTTVVESLMTRTEGLSLPFWTTTLTAKSSPIKITHSALTKNSNSHVSTPTKNTLISSKLSPMSSIPTFLDSTPTLISPRTSMKPMPCSTLYCYARRKPAAERDHRWKKSWISWFRPSWAISLKNSTSLKLWNCILSSTKSQWTPCWPKNSKDTTVWSRLYEALSKTSSSHFWVKSSWTHHCKMLPKPSSTAKSLNCGWANRIHR